MWRHQVRDTFVLVGQVAKYFATTGAHQLTGADAGNIQVQAGDVLGFYNTGQVPMPYDLGACGTVPALYWAQGIQTAQVVGQSYNVPIDGITSCRTYSFNVEVTGRCFI